MNEKKTDEWYVQLQTCKDAETVENKIKEGIKGYNMDKSKRECLYEVIKACREHAWAAFAYTLCIQLLKIPLPDNTLYKGFDEDVYDFLSDYEMSIVAYYGEDLQAGLKSSNYVMLSPFAPSSVKTNVLNNLKFYIQSLKYCIHNELIYPEKEKGWNLFNPGICILNNEIIVNCRLANSGGMWFHLNEELGGFPVSSKHPIVTENVRTKLFSDDWKMFHCSHNLQTFDDSWVKGLEDCKLFTLNNEVWFLATAKEFTPTFLCKTLIGNRGHLVVLKSPFPERNEKNWLPFEYKGKLLSIYSYSPFKILEVDPCTGDTVTFLEQNYDHLNMHSFRGSGGPARSQNNEYYFIVHEVRGHPQRFYFHRILKMNCNLQLTHISLPFQMLGHNDIEYVSGLVIRKEEVFIAYGDDDKRAMIATMTLFDFDKLCLCI